jgi:[calcium/calmodulin-dependent protein kinase] kinase
MEPISSNKIVNVNYTNIFNSKNKQISKNNKKTKSNETINKASEVNHHQKLYNRNLLIPKNLNYKQGINSNSKTNNLKNYINNINIKNIYNKPGTNNNINRNMKINNTIKTTNENGKMIIRSNNNSKNNSNAKNKMNLMNVLIKKKNNNSFNFNNINKFINTESINNKISKNNNTNNKILPGLKNNKKSIDNTIKTNKFMNAFTPNIILNDINNKTYNNKNFNFNLINNIKINNTNNLQQIQTTATNTNTITEYPNINNKLNLNINTINSSSKDDSDINLNLFYKKNNPNTKNKYEIIETDKVTVNYDKKTGNKIVNEFYFLETIGRGAYSKVKKCINLNTREEFAVKILNKRLLRKKKKSYGKTKEGTLKINYMIEDAINEINIYKSFPEVNDNVIRLYQILNDNKKDKTYLIMELAQKGPLVTLNEKNGVFCLNKNYKDDIYDEKLMKKWILDIAKGLKFLHENNVVHRDIKSDNILIDKNGNCKIADFGCSIKLKNNQADLFSKTEGNMYFFPPEFVDGKSKKQFGYKPVDIWAFGVSMYTCIFKSLPFLPENRENVVELFREIRESKFDYNKNGVKISKDMEILLGHILDKDPNKRFTAKDIVEYPWLNNK